MIVRSSINTYLDGYDMFDWNWIIITFLILVDGEYPFLGRSFILKRWGLVPE